VDFAEDKNAQYQTAGLKLLDAFKQEKMLNAMKAHGDVRPALELMRQKFEESITNPHAKSIFKNNSQRSMRLIQEGADRHFEAEENTYHKFSYEQGQASDTRMIAANPAGAAEKLESMRVRAMGYVQGADDETVKQFAAAAQARGADALMRKLTKPGAALEPAKEAFAKFGHLLGAREQADVQEVIGKKEAIIKGEQTVQDIKNENTNPHARINEDKFNLAYESVPIDAPFGEVQRAAMTRAHAREEAMYRTYGASQAQELKAEGVAGSNSLKMQELESTHPDLALGLKKMWTQEAHAAQGRTEHATKVAQDKAYQSELWHVTHMTSEEARADSKDLLDARMNGKANSTHINTLEKLLAERQKPATSFATLNKISGAFSKDARMEVHTALMEYQAAHPDAPEKELQDYANHQKDIIPTGETTLGFITHTAARWQVNARARTAGGVRTPAASPVQDPSSVDDKRVRVFDSKDQIGWLPEGTSDADLTKEGYRRAYKRDPSRGIY
jgi:hypothetical protein